MHQIMFQDIHYQIRGKCPEQTILINTNSSESYVGELNHCGICEQFTLQIKPMYNDQLFIKIKNKIKIIFKKSIQKIHYQTKQTEIVLYHIPTTMAAGKYDVNMKYQPLCPSSCSDFVWLRQLLQCINYLWEPNF